MTLGLVAMNPVDGQRTRCTKLRWSIGDSERLRASATFLRLQALAFQRECFSPEEAAKIVCAAFARLSRSLCRGFCKDIAVASTTPRTSASMMLPYPAARCGKGSLTPKCRCVASSLRRGRTRTNAQARLALPCLAHKLHTTADPGSLEARHAATEPWLCQRILRLRYPWPQT